MPIFADRRSAGKFLAEKLVLLRPDVMNNPNVLVLGLPRGGIPVAFEVAKKIHAALDAYVVRKLGAPGQEELAIGALAMDGSLFLDTPLIKSLGINPEDIARIQKREQDELARRATLYRRSIQNPDIAQKKIILVDDGIATGSSMKAAIFALKNLQPSHLIIAIPVAPPSSIRDLQSLVDEIVCLQEPESFIGVGLWYRDFSQTTDTEVADLLESHRSLPTAQKYPHNSDAKSIPNILLSSS